jgi:N-methylhydantoinase A
MRYGGQNYEINIPVNRGDLSVEDIAQRFDERHEYLYGFSLSDVPHEVLRVRTSAIGKVMEEGDILNAFSTNEEKGRSDRPLEVRKVWEESGEPMDYRIYKRPELDKGITIEGPAVVEEMDSTVYIPSGSQAGVDSFGNIVISIV